MAIIQPTLWMENSPDHHAQAYRLFLEALTTGAAGVWPNATAVTETTGAEMKVRVKSNHFLVPRTAAANQGSSMAFNDGDVDLDIEPADGLNDRIDLVIFRLNDSAMVGTPNTDDGTLEVVTGVAAASPSVPAAPADALALAQVLVRAGTSSIEDGLGDIANLASMMRRPGLIVAAAPSWPTTFEKADYPGLRAVKVCGRGPGGGGAGAGTDNRSGAGGGQGEYGEVLILVEDLVASETITLGAPGAGGAAGNNPGGDGGTTSFGTHLVLNGGSHGNPHNLGGEAGVGGSGGVGVLLIKGADGHPTGLSSAVSGGNGGGEGGGRGGGLTGTARPGAAGERGGGGGGGARVTGSAAGGAGGRGWITIELIY